MNTFFVFFVLSVSCVLAQSYNPCETVGSCCFSISFASTPGIEGVAVSDGSEILPRGGSPWGNGSLNVNLGVDPSMVRPGTNNWLYPLGLLDTSTVTVTDDWKGLRLTGGGNVAVVTTMLAPEVTVYRGNTILWANFTSKPVCLKSISLMRTVDIDHRMGTSITLNDPTGTPIDHQTYPWSLTSTNWLNVSYATNNVGSVRMSFVGVGYGAFVGLSACYLATSFDQCGICGGNGSRCSLGPLGPHAGDPCFNASIGNPACQAGIYNFALQCIPELFNVTQEECNGVDDDCDGYIDNGVEAESLTCGVGACETIVWRCSNGTGPNATCTPGTPTPEICNGIDDDCNGIIDDPPVCSQPVDGVVITPLALCVEGRLSPSSTQCFAHFGYWNSDPVFNVTRQYGTDMNSLAIQPDAPLTSTGINVPSFFLANGSVTDAFQVPIQCQDGGAAVWSIGDGEGHYLEATVYASSAPPCETYIGRPEALTRPITVFVDAPCVTRANNTCTVALGYYNPNQGAPAYFVPASATQNSFFMGASATPTNFNPPAMFFQQRVRQAAIANWACPLGTEVLRWQLVTAGVSHQAVASAASSCE